MSMRRFPAPSSVSEAARKFLNEAPPIQRLDTSLDALRATRRELYDLFAPVGTEIASKLGVKVEPARIADVPVEWVVPREVGGPGLVLYFFGGGYVTGSPGEDLAITARLAHALRRRVCAVSYRLAPEHPCPAALDDASAVYGALLSEYSAGSIALAGESAGGNLSVALIGRLAAKGLAVPAAAALISPWCDLTHSGDTIATLAGLDPTLDCELNLGAMARAYAGGQPLASPVISPLFADVPKGFPPTLVTSGTRDLLLSDAARLTAKLRAAGIATELQVTEGMWHVFEFYHELPEAEASIQAIAGFLNAHLR